MLSGQRENFRAFAAMPRTREIVESVSHPLHSQVRPGGLSSSYPLGWPQNRELGHKMREERGSISLGTWVYGHAWPCHGYSEETKGLHAGPQAHFQDFDF